MNLKNRPSQAKDITKSISRMKQKAAKGEVKEGVDLARIVRTVARRQVENAKAGSEE